MPVIRISDDIFAQLQELAQPLVDTPSTVIERLLNERSQNGLGQARGRSTERPAPASGFAPQPTRTPPGFSLFLAPASDENLRATIERAVPLADARTQLSPELAAELSALLGDRTGFHCWAMSVNSRGTFNKMKTGDVVLLSTKNSGLFDFRGMVLGKLESASLGNHLWRFTSGQPWSLIYILDDVTRIAVRKDALNAELGYDRSYRVPGVIRVNSAALRAAIARHGSLDQILSATAAAPR